MWTSNINRRAVLLYACGLAFPLAADDLKFADGSSHLTGTVRSIDGADRVELVSPLSPEPLVLRGKAIEKVEFSSAGTVPEPPSALIELANGDLLPATVESLDDRTLTITSPATGRLEIPRDRLKSMQLGIRQRKVVYSGPNALKEWNDGETEAKNWEFRNKGLIAKGPASASRKIALPRQFILRFTLKWQDKQVPNFQVHFADPLKAKGERCDRYYLQFGGAGMEIKREAAKGKRYNTIVQLNRTPNQFPDRQIQVEIRENRDEGRLQLFLNGEREGEFIDPISPLPDGSGISLISNIPNGGHQEIRDIEVLEFDDSHVRHHAEERGDPKTDSLISREDDRWSGRLIDIRKTEQGTVFRFSNHFQDDPLMEIPEADVSTVFFASEQTMTPAGGGSRFVLNLRSEGSLQAASCRFTEDTVFASHPLLGPLELRRDAVVSLNRTISKPKPAPEP